MYDFATALCRHVYARYLSKLISVVVVVVVAALRKHCNGPSAAVAVVIFNSSR